jgi:hypothetical protein
MGFAAAAYGHLAMNFLEFIPRGLYQSDILHLLTPGVTNANIIREQDQNSLYHPSFILIDDITNNTLVLSIRGSLNIHDIITDLTCQHYLCHTHLFHTSEYKHLENIEEDVVCHEGFLLSAQNLDILLREEILEFLKTRPTYSLVICGHSLGAGVASLLTIKWSTIFPSVRYCLLLDIYT